MNYSWLVVRGWWFVTTLLLLGTFAGTADAQSSAAMPIIRVALVSNAAQLTVQANPFFCGLASDSPENTSAWPLTKAVLRGTEAGFLVNEQFFEGNQLLCRTGEGRLLINGELHHGPLSIYRMTNNMITAVVDIPVEQYLVGVLHGELNPTWPDAALRAQAVAARSYTLAQQRAKAATATVYDLESGVGDQMYHGSRPADARIVAAVDDTRGEVLAINGQPLKAYYHSCCGGMTEPAANVWGAASAQGFEAIHDTYCMRAPHYKWRWSVNRQRLRELLAAAGYPTTAVRGLQVMREANGERIGIIAVETDGDLLQFSGNQFRRIVGYQELKSTLFKIRERRGVWEFEGRGYGHGAGLCQWGAKGMAEKGKSYRHILEFYYPGVTLTKWY